MYPKFPAFCRWRERMDNLPATQKVRAVRAARSDPACPRMGELAPAEILTAKRLAAEAVRR